MKFRILSSTIFIAGMSATAALAHPGHVVDGGNGHTHWLAIAAVGSAVVVGVVTWMRRRADRRIARDRKL